MKQMNKQLTYLVGKIRAGQMNRNRRFRVQIKQKRLNDVNHLGPTSGVEGHLAMGDEDPEVTTVTVGQGV